MKRINKNKDRLSQVEEFFPLIFWVDCCNCEYQFVRESVYKKIFAFDPLERVSDRLERVRFLCKKCAPTKEKALDVFDSKPWVIKMPICKPPPPPPPPPPRSPRGPDS